MTKEILVEYERWKLSSAQKDYSETGIDLPAAFIEYKLGILRGYVSKYTGDKKPADTKLFSDLEKEIGNLIFFIGLEEGRNFYHTKQKLEIEKIKFEKNEIYAKNIHINPVWKFIIGLGIGMISTMTIFLSQINPFLNNEIIFIIVCYYCTTICLVFLGIKFWYVQEKDKKEKIIQLFEDEKEIING